MVILHYAIVIGSNRLAEQILRDSHGRLLSTHPSALGSVLIETTPAGIIALARSDQVKAILEDQPVSLITPER